MEGGCPLTDGAQHVGQQNVPQAGRINPATCEPRRMGVAAVKNERGLRTKAVA